MEIFGLELLRESISAIIMFIIMNLAPSNNVDITFHNGSLFSKFRDDQELNVFYSNDSNYMFKKLDSFLGNDKQRKKIVDYDWIEYFGFYWGRFYWNSDFEKPKIDICITKCDSVITIPVYSKDGSKWFGHIELTPNLDTITIPENCKKLINIIGLQEYQNLFVLAHELHHMIDYEEALRINGENYGLVRWYVYRYFSESDCDKRALEFLNKHTDEILEIYNSYY